MEVAGKVVLVTGGAHGIGRALAERFARERAHGVAVADLDGEAARRVADSIGGLALTADVSREDDIQRAVERTEEILGPIDLLCSNAGFGYSDAPGWAATSQTDAQWDRIWRLNVMSHVWGARAVLPGMVERGGGWLLQTVSAAGLLSQIGDAAYATTKHAALGFAESLAITHGDQGIGVSVLCPQGVRTHLLEGQPEALPIRAASADGVIEPEEVAESVIAALAEERFLILPHRQVADYMRHKVTDYERWLGAMRKLRRGLIRPENEITFAPPTHTP
ncbi:MAG: SDR family oxidoreductase [Acidobacteriota bacterium]